MLVVWLAFAFVAGAGTVLAIAAWREPRREVRIERRTTLSSAFEHVLDLVRRVYDGRIACLVTRDTEPLVVKRDDVADDTLIDRVTSTASLAMNDSREHSLREDGLVAVGDGRLGVALAIEAGASPDDIQAVAAELRRLVGEFHVDLDRRSGGFPRLSGAPSRPSGAARASGIDFTKFEAADVRPSNAFTRRSASHDRDRMDFVPSLDTLPAIASGLCDRARIVTGRPTAVVLRDQATQTAAVIAVSHNADRRLVGNAVSPDSAVGRACIGDTAIRAVAGDELFGRAPNDRRQREENGIAFPLRDGREGVGALVVFEPGEGLEPGVQERVMWLAVDAGPRFAAAAAIKAAEERAMTDSLTGLPNRRALDRAMAAAPQGPCAVLYVDIDHFKKLNDSFGHAAGDAALKHLARLFRSLLREYDLPARIGGEEFVMWLPSTPQESAVEVADRLRNTVESTRWEWAGAEIGLTCSIGVASRPETTTQIGNLIPAADAALYRAKRSGRNRVEMANPAELPPPTRASSAQPIPPSSIDTTS